MILEGINLPVKKNSDNRVTIQHHPTVLDGGVTRYFRLFLFPWHEAMLTRSFASTEFQGNRLKWQGTDHHPEITATKRNPQDQDQTKKIL